jgi:multisubunit Na+/H+ antiporter MnhG subunit
VDGLAVLGQQFYLESAHLEVVAGVGLVRFNDVAQLAQADCSGQFLQVGLFDAELEGEAPA